MGRNVLRRIRWANVALAAAGALAAGLVAAWAFPGPGTPGLPPDAPRPLVSDEPIPTPAAPRPEKRENSENEQRVEQERTPRKARRGGKRGTARAAEPRRPRARTRPAAAAPVAPTPPLSRVSPPRRTPAPAPPGEFGFEGSG